MRHFRLYLWKEWREQRSAALALLGLLPVLVLSVGLGVRARFLSSPLFVTATGLLALAVALIAIGGEVLGTERRRGGTWLERLPGGLAGAFSAKLALFLFTSIAAAVYGTLLGLLAALLRGKTLVALPAQSFSERNLLIALVVVGALVALWTFAASAWCLRGMLAFCAGPLLAALIALPVWMHELVRYYPKPWEWTAATGVMALGALVCGWRGFLVSGSGSGWARAAVHGCCLGAACTAPLWGWSAWQWHERDRIDLDSPECWVRDAWVFDDGRSGLVSIENGSARWRDLPGHVLRLDLERGTYRLLDGGARRFSPYWADLERNGYPARLLVTGRGMQFELLDASSGERLSETTKLPPYRDPAGLGWTGWDPDREEWAIVDPFHEGPRADCVWGYWSEVLIGPKTWWLRDAWLWFEYGPETGELVPAPWLEATLAHGPMLADGRLLVLLSDLTYALLGPGGAVEPLAAPGFTGRFTVEGGAIRAGELIVDTERQRYLLDLDCLELRPTDTSYAGELVRALPDGALFFLTARGIERRDPASGARTLVFSFADAREEVGS